ncbi:MAG: glycosyltransferase family 4 protein [Desulfobacteraceae bacterium]|nr:glycosyltransferase family 4 protein [Desulfobacteraceae bacterium]MBC2720811.1 glycosyltransferase family 4 protein [Desulfobacteraceae bacterium]
MKIFLANYRYFISGGPERYLFNITEALSERGHEVIPFSIHYSKNQSTPYSQYFVEPLGTRDEVTFRQQRFYAKTLWRTITRLFYSKDVEKAITLLVSETQPQVAYVLHYLRKLSPSLLVGLKKSGIPIVVRLSDYAMICPQAHCLRDDLPCNLCVKGDLRHSIVHKCIQKSRAASALNALATWYHQYRHFFDLIDVFVVTNQFMYKMMINAGFQESRLRCIPTFTDIEKFKPDKKINRKYITYVGRLENIKGVHVLIDALSLLHSKRPDLNIETKIFGAGEESYRDYLIKKVQQTGIEKVVHFVGEVNSDDIANLLRKSFLSVVPSLWYENLPNSILESYASGVPVLASDIGSLQDCIINGETGYLFRTGDAESLANYLEYCFDHQDKTNTMGYKAREVVKQVYSSQKHIMELEYLFHEAVDN